MIFGLLVLFIAILFPIVAIFKGYLKSSIPLRLGFIALLFVRPWHEYTGWNGMIEALILMVIVIPLYGLGLLSWFIGFIQRITNRNTSRENSEEKTDKKREQ
jgi:hypothetical protein